MQKTCLNTVLLYISYSACNPSCIGLMACTDLTGVNCCNYYGLDGACLLECPANSTTNSDFQCTCNSGYISNSSECIEIHECSLDPCQNGANCSDLYNCSR